MGGARESFGAIKLILYGRAKLRTLLPSSPLANPPVSPAGSVHSRENNTQLFSNTLVPLRYLRREAMGGARESFGAIK